MPLNYKEKSTVPVIETPEQQERKIFLTTLLNDLLLHESQYLDQYTLKNVQDAVMNPQTYSLQRLENPYGHDEGLVQRAEECVQLQLDKHALQNPHGTPEEFSDAFDDYLNHLIAYRRPPNYETLRGRKQRVRKQHVERMKHRPTPDYV